MKTGLGQPEECPDGFNCNQPGKIFECEAGTFATDDHLRCDDCPVGSFCRRGLEEKCQSGRLANSTRQEGFDRFLSIKRFFSIT